MQLLAQSLVVSLGVMVLSGAACSTMQQAVGGDVANDTVAARAALVRLEADARALATQTGCGGASGCRSAPVGAKACGGPRTYLVYCAATTDSVALFKRLDELKQAELQFNQSAGMAGTCDFRMPPSVTVQGGSCREATP